MIVVSDLKISKSLFLKIEKLEFLRNEKREKRKTWILLAKRFELTELESIVTQLQMRFSFLVLKILTELARDFCSFVDANGLLVGDNIEDRYIWNVWKVCWGLE